MRVLCLASILAATACGSKADQPVRIEYASYEDCILGKLGRGQSTVASEAIIAACRKKHPPQLVEVKNDPWAKSASPGEKSAGMFDDLVPRNRSEPEIAESADYYHDGVPIGLTFEGYDCEDDCSGHRAGWDWAERKAITNPGDCSGKSQSFIEGCQAYAAAE